MPTASKKQILLAVIFLDAEINPAGDPTLKKTCSMVHSLCRSAKNHPWDHSWHLLLSTGGFDRCIELDVNMNESQQGPEAKTTSDSKSTQADSFFFFFLQSLTQSPIF